MTFHPRPISAEGESSQVRPSGERRVVLWALIAAVWFVALAKGAHDLWAVTILCGWLSTVAIWYFWSADKDRDTFVFPLLPWTALLALAILISSRFSYDTNTTRLELWIGFCNALLFGLLCTLFRDARLRFDFLRWSSGVILPVAWIALRQFFARGPFRDHAVIFGVGLPYSHWTAPSTFTNSAVLAGFSLSWFFVLWHWRERGLVYRFLFLACLILLLVSRSWWAFISLGIGLLYTYQNRQPTVRHEKRSALIVRGTALLALIALALYIKFGVQDPLYKWEDRWVWWLAGMRMVLAHPWVGVGLGGYASALPFFKSPILQYTLYAHSLPIQLISETGLLGFSAALLLAAAYGHALMKQRVLTGEHLAYRATVLTLGVYSLTSLFTDYFIGKMMILMAVALTLSDTDMTTLRISNKSTLAIVMGLLLLTPSWYLPFRASQYHVSGIRVEEDGNDKRAESYFREALRLNPYEESSDVALARLYGRAYKRSRSVLDFSTSLFWTQEVMLLKRMSTHPDEINP